MADEEKKVEETKEDLSYLGDLSEKSSLIPRAEAVQVEIDTENENPAIAKALDDFNVVVDIKEEKIETKKETVEPVAEPKEEEPKEEEPKDEEPKDEEPKDEEPKDEEPKDEEPKDEEPPELGKKEVKDIVEVKKEEIETKKLYEDKNTGLHEEAENVYDNMMELYTEQREAKLPERPGENASEEAIDDFKYEKRRFKEKQEEIVKKIKTSQKSLERNLTKRWKNLELGRPTKKEYFKQFNEYLHGTKGGQIDLAAVSSAAKPVEKVFDQWLADVEVVKETPAKKAEIRKTKAKVFKTLTPKSTTTEEKKDTSKYPYLELEQYQDTVKELRKSGKLLTGEPFTDEELNDIVKEEQEMDSIG